MTIKEAIILILQVAVGCMLSDAQCEGNDDLTKLKQMQKEAYDIVNNLVVTEYTVILLYPDYIAEDFGQDTYITVVKAKNRNDAVYRAQQELAAANDAIDDYTDAAELAVILGEVEFV